MKFIKDPLYENIICSNLEFEIFALPILNRLHYIMQNSMAYLVYPMDRTSRFAHSIGVMHIASQIFLFSIANASEEVCESYKNYIKNKINNEMGHIIDSMKKLDFVSKERYLSREDDVKKVIDKGVEEILGKEFIKSLPLKDNFLLMTLQALRLTALFHDIGHLPYSHLGEMAVVNFLTKNSEKENFKNIFGEFGEPPLGLHEEIGIKLTKLIFTYLKADYRERYKEKNTNDKKYRIFSKYFVLSIVETIYNKIISSKMTGEFIELYKIVSSDLDADRLDYVKRDGFASGVFDTSFDLDRIIKTFYLIKNKESFKILPSLKAINDINRFYWDRFFLFRMVINHHKVKKFDAMLQISIEKILEEDLKNIKYESSFGTRFEDKINVNNMIDMIFIIKALLDCSPDELSKEEIKRLFLRFFQLTDFWLLNIIKQKMVTSLSEDKNNSQLLSEVLFGSKSVTPLYKRSYECKDNFQEIDTKSSVLTDEISMIDDDGIIIVLLKSPSDPVHLEIYDHKNKKIIKATKVVLIQESNKGEFFVYFFKDKYSRDDVIEKVKKFIKEIKKEVNNEQKIQDSN